jgi:hypothetical protein
MFNNHCALFNNYRSVADLTVGFLENINDVIYLYRCLQQLSSIKICPELNVVGHIKPSPLNRMQRWSMSWHSVCVSSSYCMLGVKTPSWPSQLYRINALYIGIARVIMRWISLFNDWIELTVKFEFQACTS